MRVQYRGGLWTNAEDEVVKAAIAKYGRNQWSRIASLLPRKSAKQVKARWCEWLSPDIRKTEWTREEEEKLLHLAKIMPTQWRTIAPMIGRTAAQCLEHYERLLEDAQRSAADPGAASSGDVPTAAGGEARSRFDEMVAETKPARPDAVDMNEEEKEMLSEARARLANTRGKKAKRKAREKQLEAAKRMAQLQKRRELKAAGIIAKPHKLKKGTMDLTTEIPYARAPVPGFYDTREEDAVGAREKRDVRGLGRLISKYETEQREEIIDEEARREAVKRKFVFGDPGDKKGAGGGAGAAADPALKRSRMTLPAPQVSDSDLEVIAKAGVSPAAAAAGASGSAAPAIPQTGGSLLSGARHPLLATPAGSVASSAPASSEKGEGGPQMWADVRDRQVRQLMKLQSASTPLVGGDSSSLPKSLEVHDSVTPMSTVQRTPNPLATPSFVSTGSVATRDTDDTALLRSEKARLQSLKRELRKGLDALPDPENEYVLNVNDGTDAAEDVSDEENGRSGGMQTDEREEDVEDELKRLKREGREALQNAKKRGYSLAAQRDLSIPPLPVDLSGVSDDVTKLVERDAVMHHLLLERSKHTELSDADIAKRIGGTVALDNSDGGLAAARALVEAEVAQAKQNERGMTEDNLLSEVERLRCEQKGELWVVDEKGHIVEAATSADVGGALRLRSAHALSLKKSVKNSQRNLGKRLHGFEKKRNDLQKELVALMDLITKSKQELVCFTQLAEMEEAAIPRRIAELENGLERQKVLERQLQRQYAAATTSLRADQG